MFWQPDLKDYRVKTAEENKEINYGAVVRPLPVFKSGVFLLETPHARQYYKWRHCNDTELQAKYFTYVCIQVGTHCRSQSVSMCVMQAQQEGGLHHMCTQSLHQH